MSHSPSIFGRVALAVSALRGKAFDPYDKYFRDAPEGGGRADAHHPYKQVSVVYACVRTRLMAFAQMPLLVSTQDGELLESGPLVDITEQPNPRMTRRQFWKATVAYLDLTGACYWWISSLGGNDRSRPVHVYPYSRVKFRKRTEAAVHVGWWYRTDQGAEVAVPLDEVHEVIEPDYEEGLDTPLSPKQAVHLAVQQYYKSDRANLSSLDNDVQPGGLLRTDGNLTDDQRRALLEQVRERHAGVLNRRQIMVGEGGLHFERIQAAFSEMEFSELKRMSRVDICAGYLVPPATAGYYEDSNYSHSESASKIFWVNTMIPLAETLAEEWTSAVLSRFAGFADADRGLTTRRPTTAQRTFTPALKAARAASARGLRHHAWFDANDVPQVQEARLAVAELAYKWWSMGVPLNQLIQSTGAPLKEVAWGDDGYRPMGLVGYGEDTTLDEPPAGEPPAPEDEDLVAAEPGKALPGHARALTAAQLETLHEMWWTAIQPLVSRFRKKLSGHQRDLHAEMRRNLKRLDAAKAQTHKRDVVGELLFNLARADNNLVAKLGPFLRDAFILGGAQSMQDAAVAAGKDAAEADPFRIEAPRVVAELRRRTNKITGTNHTLFRKLQGKLADGVSQGMTTAQLGDVIADEMKVAYGRAVTIARTEVAGAVEAAKHEGRRQSGVPLKSWLSSRREDLRDWHLAAERQTHAKPIGVDELFVIPVTGNTCQHPRGTNDPRDDVNCGCTTLSRFADDGKDARLLDHHVAKGFLTLDAMPAPQAEGTAQ